MSIDKKKFSSVRWSGISTFTRVFLSFLQIFVLARYIPPSEFGIMALAVTVVNIINIASDIGISQALIRFQVRDERIISTLFWVNFLFSIILTFFIISLSGVIAEFYNEPELANVLLLLSISFPITSVSQIVKALAEMDLQFRRLAIAEIFSMFISVLVAIISALLFDYGVYSLVFGVISLSVASSFLAISVVKPMWHPIFAFDIIKASTHLSFGVRILFTGLLNAFGAQADIIVSGRLFSAGMVGLYSQPRDLSFKIMMALNPIINRVTLPMVASFREDRKQVGVLYKEALLVILSVNFPIYLYLFFSAGPVVRLALGPNWEVAVPFMEAVAVWSLFRCIGNPIGSLLTGTGRVNRYLFSSFIVTTLVLLFSYVSGRLYGLISIPYALAVLYFMLIIFFYRFCIHSVCEFPFRDYLLTILRPMLISILSCGPLYALKLSDMSDILYIIASFVIFVIAYVGASYIFNKEFVNFGKRVFLEGLSGGRR
ncbi:lipopolysaccharide biosynthesis protein [Pannonibacter sp. Q-1]|nr:hypothetical protein [Polymorphum sp.]